MSCNKPKFAAWPNDCPYVEYNEKCSKKDCMHHKYDLHSLIDDLQPFVSIIMPYHNASLRVFDRAVRTIVAQEYSNWELIIVNDGSESYHEKSIQTILNKVIPKDKTLSVKVIKQEHYGQAVARNNAFKSSIGDYIAYLDSDDEWIGNHLTDCLMALLNNEAEFVYADFNYKYFTKSFEVHHIVNFKYGEETIGRELDLLEATNFVAINTVMHTRRAFILGGGFEPGVVCGEDGLLWRRMLQAGVKVTHSASVTSYYCRYDHPEMHQSKILKMPSAIEGKHLIGKGSNGQELDNQEEYNKRFEELKRYYKSKEIMYRNLNE